MEVDDDGNVLRNLRQRALGRLERAFRRLHEHPALEVEDGDTPDRQVDNAPAAAGALRGEIGRAHQALDAADLSGELLLAPGVVAEGDRVRPGFEDLLRQRGGYARARGAVLGVDDRRRGAAACLEPLELAPEDPPAGVADHVADHQHRHLRPSSHFAAAVSPRQARDLIFQKSAWAGSMSTPMPLS